MANIDHFSYDHDEDDDDADENDNNDDHQDKQNKQIIINWIESKKKIRKHFDNVRCHLNELKKNK